MFCDLWSAVDAILSRHSRRYDIGARYCRDPANKWLYTDLTDFSVDAWEPSHDTELWKKQRKLHLFVQHTRQGDGERTAEIDPQMVYVLETDMNINK